MRCDVLVVGGGPVGCTAAASMAADLDVKVVEEHPRIGEPVQCAGLVTPRVVDMVSAQDAVLNHIDGVYLHFPGGRTLTLQGDGVKAVVVDRGEFDRRCCDLAIKAGAEVLTSRPCVSVERTAEGFTLDAELRSRALLAADGYRSNVSKLLNLGPPREIVRGIEMDLRMRLEDQRKVQVFLGRTVAPGFFAWAIPCGDLTRVGLCVTPGNGTPQRYLNDLLQRQGWSSSEKVRTYSGVIPLGHMERTYVDRALIAGDAAGMAKPLSGGGLYTGMTAGRLAAETLKEAFIRDDLSAGSLSSYQDRWMDSFGRELRNSYRVRKLFVRMNDRDLDRVGARLDRTKVRNVLSEGDIDFPTALAPKVIKACPSLMAIAPLLLLRLLRR
ncbi:MAG: NAD(P)/FAD-dependent oxidoreductase [Methanomassiliicoccales archaeon]|nr:NAD(P)/FAD-dependent oxidoreductase [Methanomassiliicoccales archaeon]